MGFELNSHNRYQQLLQAANIMMLTIVSDLSIISKSVLCNRNWSLASFLIVENIWCIIKGKRLADQDCGYYYLSLHDCGFSCHLEYTCIGSKSVNPYLIQWEKIHKFLHKEFAITVIFTKII